MAIVVIVLMVGFIGGTYFQQLARRRPGRDRTVAYFGDKEEITNYDPALARRELEILKMLQADNMLKNISLPLLRMPDLRPFFLGELLFSERRTSSGLVARVKQIVRANRYRISDKQINDIYRRSMGSEIYWLLLKNEAQLAGIRISEEQTGGMLGRTIPEFTDGATYSQVISSIVNQRGIPEEEILTTFGKLMAVMEYGRMVCGNEDMTSSQIMHNASWEDETIDVELVRLDSSVFAETQSQPTEEGISAHFDDYKWFLPGEVSDHNPYGFGYKLPEMVQLEYIVVELDDVSSIVAAPTEEETEEYYQRYRERFVATVPSDPNDPNSLQIERIRSYAEVAGMISEQLLQERINSRAERILQEAKSLTEAGFEDIDTEPQSLSAEQFRQIAGDYEATAEELAEKHKIKVYTGKTGLLSAAEMQTDEHLGMLYVRSYGYNPTGLIQIVFAIDELKASELGPFDAPEPRLYENIGPVTDALGEIMVLVRVTRAEKASVPEDINQTFSKATLEFEQTSEAGEDVYSVKERVTEDLKKLAAMDTARNKARELVGLVTEVGWDSAVDKFNELYGQQAESDPNVFRLQNLANLQRVSGMMLETLTLQSEGNPMAWFLVNEEKKQSQLIDRLYSLVPQDAIALEAVAVTMEFKPAMSYYVIKDVSVRPLGREQYENTKALRVYKEGLVQSQSLAVVHFNPENILKRMKFRPVGQDEEAADANAPAEGGGAS
jgi:hypothetical protein